MNMLQEIVDLAVEATTRPTATSIPRVMTIKGDVPRHQLAALYEPVIGFVVQGNKRLSIAGEILNLEAPSYFLLPLHLPATAVVRAKNGKLPYLSVGLSLSQKVVRGLLRDVGEVESNGARKFSPCVADDKFVEAWVRMLRLLKTPADIPALAPVYEREILYRVLTGPQGFLLRDLAFRQSNLSRISQAVNWLRENYKQEIDIKQMASEAAMALTTFHRQFKRVTGLSPVQFQKQLRLFEARNILAFEGYAVANAAYEVGYQSPSQFNREYTRFFGTSPARDANALRRIENERA